MATFTTIQKNRLSWVAPVVVSTAGLPEVDFLFSDSSDFLFSDSSDFVFREATSERVDTPWTKLIRKRVTF